MKENEIKNSCQSKSNEREIRSELQIFYKIIINFPFKILAFLDKIFEVSEGEKIRQFNIFEIVQEQPKHFLKGVLS